MIVSLKRLSALGIVAALTVAACGTAGASPSPAASSARTTAPTGAATAAPSAALAGDITIDGSSTVYPITEAVAEEFQKANPGVRVTVAFSGTGGGFKKFCNGETDANDASRPIKDEETKACQAKSIEPVELEVAFDGLSVLVNPQNTWAECMTVDELKKLWDAGSTVKTWADIRPDWPADQIKLFGPGADSGTFDYFTEEINGEAKKSRADYTQSEDDNALVQGIAGEKNALGYFGFAYYEENTDKLKLVGVDSGTGCVTPSRETIADGSYAPLSRPLLIYAAKQSLDRPEVAAFFQYYLENAGTFAAEVGYVELPAERLQKAKDALAGALK